VRRAALLWLVVTSLAGYGVDAEGQEVDAESRAHARELVKSGDVSYRLFKFDRALADYQEAYRLAQHPAIIFNIAQAYRQLKNYEKAHFYYKLFLADWSKKFPDKPPPYEAEVKAHIKRLAALIEEERQQAAASQETAPKPPKKAAPARLELEGLRQGAVVYVDGSPSDSGPSVALDPGRHAVRVELDGYRPWTAEVELQAGKLRTERVDLRVSDHRTAWLVTSASLSAVAAGLLGFGAYHNARHNDFISGTPEADDSKRLSVIGYAAAGGVAALAAASWTIYLLHRRKVLRLMEDRTAAELAAGIVRF